MYITLRVYTSTRCVHVCTLKETILYMYTASHCDRTSVKSHGHEKFVDGAVPRSAKAERTIEIGGGTNSLCKNVVEWLKNNMGVSGFGEAAAGLSWL